MASGYGARWRRLRARLILERGHVCEDCGARDVPVAAHHIDRLGMAGPRAYDPSNLTLLCARCHRRASRRSATA